MKIKMLAVFILLNSMIFSITKSHDSDLPLSAMRGEYAKIKIYLEGSGDVNVIDSTNSTMIIGAAAAGHFSVVQLLIDWKADVNHQNKFGESALQVAVCSANDDNYINILNITELLLKSGANPALTNKKGESAITCAKQNQLDEIYKILSSISASDLKKIELYTKAADAVQDNNLNVVVSLIKQGVDVNFVPPQKRPLLWEASAAGNAQICELLLKNGANPNIVEGMGDTPVHAASSGGYFEEDDIKYVNVLKVLIKYKADLNVKNYMRAKTPLIIAAKNGKLSIVKILIENGADTSISDADGFSPYDHAQIFAEKNGDDKVSKYLEKYYKK